MQSMPRNKAKAPMQPVPSNKENMRLWVAALRSGEYEQGHGALHDHNDKFCCLGVACEVALKAGVKMPVTPHGNYIRYGQEISHLPTVVQEWLGLPVMDPFVAPMVSAVSANDGHRWSFEQIADSVEALYGLREEQ